MHQIIDQSSQSANVHKALESGGKESLQVYEEKLPDGFHAPIATSVITMATKRRRLQLRDGEPVFDTELIFARTMGLMSTMEFNLRELFKYELSQIPTSLFTDNGSLRPSTAKSKLKKSIVVEQSSRITPNPKILVLDGCAILWTLHWPVPGTVADLVTEIETYLCRKLAVCDEYRYLIFNRYITH